jgi:hypothetical protein
MRAWLLALVTLPQAAHASPEFALGVNSPVSIAKGFAYGVSGYIALDEHQALRTNVASYESDYLWEDEIDAALSGHKYDVSISYVYYPRRVWDGFLLDAGVLGRRHHAVSYDYDYDRANWVADTNTIAARGMAGWSWLFGGHVFIAVAVGASYGYEFGSVTYPTMERAIGERSLFPESYLRVGGAF